MRPGKLWTTAAIFGCGLVLATCSGGGPKPAGKDAGAADVYVPECVVTFDCSEGGDCKDGVCVKCTADTCVAGQVCNELFRCVNCTGGSCGASDASVGGCTTRADCPADKICKSKKCQAPDPSGACLTNEECVAGQVCNFQSNPYVCIVGCASNDDCMGVVLDGGLPAPHCDNQVTHQCGPCVDGNDCAMGETCKDQRCQVAPECVPPDRSACEDRACIAVDGGGYACGPCSVKEECGAGYDCVGGKCNAVSTGCTDDSACKTISPGHICDEATGQCEWGCLPRPSDAGPCPNCCPADKECNTATHKCDGEACADCNPPCMGIGQICDTSTCTCRNENEVGDGGTANGCDPETCAGCPSGLTCKCGMAPGSSMFSCSALANCNSLPGVVLGAFCE